MKSRGDICCEFLPVIQDLLCRLEYAAKNVLEIKERVETLLLEENDDDIDSCNYLNIHLDKLLSYLLKDARNLKEKADSLILGRQGIPSPQTLIFITRRGHCRGRPKIHVDIDRVCTLREMGISWSVISKLLGISRRTLYQRCKEANVLVTYRCDPVAPTDDEIDGVVQNLKKSMPNTGERLVIGHFRAIGMCVSRERIRKSIHRVDPLNTALRWNYKIHRRVYSVAGPNSLWHIGNFIQYVYIIYNCIHDYIFILFFYLFEQVTSQYYHLFYNMEEAGLLDPLNDQHLLALH